MNISASGKHVRGQLTFMVLAILVLFALSFVPDTRKAVTSSEVHFSEISKHGLNIEPASCALSASYYHVALVPTQDGGGYGTRSGETERGAYSASSGMYVCVAANNSGGTFFIPAKTASELQSFKNASAGLGVPTY